MIQEDIGDNFITSNKIGIGLTTAKIAKNIYPERAKEFEKWFEEYHAKHNSNKEYAIISNKIADMGPTTSKLADNPSTSLC